MNAGGNFIRADKGIVGGGKGVREQQEREGSEVAIATRGKEGSEVAVATRGRDGSEVAVATHERQGS